MTKYSWRLESSTKLERLESSAKLEEVGQSVDGVCWTRKRDAVKGVNRGGFRLFK